MKLIAAFLFVWLAVGAVGLLYLESLGSSAHAASDPAAERVGDGLVDWRYSTSDPSVARIEFVEVGGARIEAESPRPGEWTARVPAGSYTVQLLDSAGEVVSETPLELKPSSSAP